MTSGAPCDIALARSARGPDPRVDDPIRGQNSTPRERETLGGLSREDLSDSS
jgi:hypothetical protein